MLNRAIDNAREAGWLGENIQGSGFDFDIELHLGAGSVMSAARKLRCSKASKARLASCATSRRCLRSKACSASPRRQQRRHAVVGAGYHQSRRRALRRVRCESLKRHARVSARRQYQAWRTRRKSLRRDLRELIEDWGGGTASGRPVKAVQVGGPLGAYIPADQLDTPLDYEAFIAIGAMIGHGGIVVFDDTANMAQQARFAMEFCAIESCGKCTPCSIGSTRGVEVIDR